MLIIIITFLLGVVASSNDYKSENLSADVNFQGQDTQRLCQIINISSDGEAERTEYFTVALRRPVSGRELAACQVAITDKDGGKHRVVYLAEYNLSNTLSQLYDRSL